MSLHVFGSFVTSYGTAANNRGETDGNTTTLQKLVWHGRPHTTVSAEAIRFALRRRLAEYEPVNRGFDDALRQNTWQDPEFEKWASAGQVFIDDDLLGFMSASAAKDEAVDVDEQDAPADGKKAGKVKKKGTTKVRRAVLEVTRAVSLTPWAGDVTFNAASPGATPSAAKKGSANPVPYATEMHATRYQYGIALTPEKLRDRTRAQTAIRSLCSIGPVAGNHGRFLYDFSPEAVVFRLSQDPAPRILYCFESAGTGVSIPELIRRVRAGDVNPQELVIGGSVADGLSGTEGFEEVTFHAGVTAAAEDVCRRLQA